MARPKFPSDDVDRVMVRFPTGLKDRIAESAKLNKRSLNNEIVSVLGDVFPAEPDPGMPHTPVTIWLPVELHEKLSKAAYPYSLGIAITARLYDSLRPAPASPVLEQAVALLGEHLKNEMMIILHGIAEDPKIIETIKSLEDRSAHKPQQSQSQDREAQG